MMSRFLHAHSFTYRLGTHESQKPPELTTGESLEYVISTKQHLEGPSRHEGYIINMDQTAIPFSFQGKRTIELVGTKTIHARKSTSDTKRATLAATVCADGTMLTPMLVFKGKPGGRIETKQIPEYPVGCVYEVQHNAWMDECVMLLWVEKILAPYLLTAPDWVIPILLLDSYRCHMMASVVNRIQDLGCEVDHIPGGCTGLCQPVDVGINKPLKSRIRQQWLEWMMGEGVDTTKVCVPPTREQIAEWVLAGYNNLPLSVRRNAWRHEPYHWFNKD